MSGLFVGVFVLQPDDLHNFFSELISKITQTVQINVAIDLFLVNSLLTEAP